jgi:predicted permease
VIHDFRVAWRFLLKSPLPTGLAVLTLGVTVGVCGLSVAAIDESFWRPLNVNNGRDLLTVYNARPAAPQYQTLSYPDYVAVREALATRVDLAAFVRVFQTLADGQRATRVQGELVSGTYFSVLGASPLVGRFVGPDDDGAPLAHAVVVLGHDLWRRQFGANPAIVGTSVTLSRRAYTVVGIAPPGFRGPAYPSEFWIPVMMAPEVLGRQVLAPPGVPFLQTVGRLTAGASREEIRRSVEGLETSASHDGWRLTALTGEHLKYWPAYREMVARYLTSFAMLGTCVLVIACANVGSLLLARNGERERELAIRQALGASPRQILRRLALESVTLTAAGGAVGVLVAYNAASVVQQVRFPVPVRVTLTPDMRVMAISLAVAFIAGFLFTAIFVVKRMFRGSRHILADSSPSGARIITARAVVVVQVAMCCVCLTAAGLLTRSATAVDRIDVGVDASQRILGLVGAGDAGYSAEAGVAFYARLQQALESEAQVQSVALEWTALLGSMRGSTRVSVGGDEGLTSRYNVVSAGYFEAMALPVLYGREFEPQDRVNTEAVAIVNETLAARLADGGIGQSIVVGDGRVPRRIIGVVADLKYNVITERAQPFLYLPLAQAFRPDMAIHIRTIAPDPEALLRDTVHRLDPNVAVSEVRPLSEQIDQARATPRLAARVSGALAFIAVLLAVVGLYGVIATWIDNRKQELAIRAAIGAGPRDLIALVAVGGLQLLGTGLVVGMATSLLSSTLLAALLYGVEPRDPLVFTLVPLALLAVSFPAWWIPAHQLSRIEPSSLLKAR